MSRPDQLTHLDLFSGIGGFALAAQWAGFRTVGFCEIEPYGQRVLAKNFNAVLADTAGRDAGMRREQQQGAEPTNGKPSQLLPNASGGSGGDRAGDYHPPIFTDIRTLDGAEFAGVDLITGGFPCQPFSCAGKRRGTADDRHLWPEMLRVIAEARPAWVLGENVAGIINMELDTVLSDLEGIGYACRPFVIPACGVDARHRRNRVWIVGHSTSEQDHGKRRDSRCDRRGVGRNREASQQDDGKTDNHCVDGSGEALADTPQVGWRQGSKVGGGTREGTRAPRQRSGLANGDSVLDDAERRRQSRSREHERCVHAAPDRDREADRSLDSSKGRAAIRLPESAICRVVDGLPEELDGGFLNANQGMDSEGDAPAGTEISLRGLWERVAARAASQGRRSFQQLAGELADALCAVPHETALADRKAAVATALGYLRNLWQGCEALGVVRNPSDPLDAIWQSLPGAEADWAHLAACHGPFHSEWPATARVATGISKRVDRLRGLGNAIVPQVAFQILKAIAEIENRAAYNAA